MSAATQIDYDALARQAGAQNIDYDAIAAQHGATPSAAPSPAPTKPSSPSLTGGNLLYNLPANVVAHIAGAVSGPYHALTDAPQNPQEQAEAGTNANSGVVAKALGHIGLGAARVFINPTLNSGAAAIQSVKAGNYNQAGQQAMDAIPIAGPWARNIENEAQTKGIIPALAGAATDVGVGEGMGKMVSKMLPAQPVPGQNYTPANARAFEGLIAKPGVTGKSFIPQDVTPQALSAIRASASDMLANGSPEEQAVAKVATAGGKAPMDQVGALHQVIQKSLTNLESQHAPVLAQYANAPVDMTPIQQSLAQNIVPGMSSADVAGVQDLMNRAGEIKTLGDLNNFRSMMNDEASPSYRNSPTAANRASAPQQIATDTANAVRDHYFQNLQQLSGNDFRPLKLQESNLLTAKEAMENMQSPLAKSEAEFNSPSTLRDSAGNLANLIKDPRATVTQTILRQSPATRPAYLISQAMRDLPDVQPVTPASAASVGPPPGRATVIPRTGLPNGAKALTSGVRQLPPSVKQLLLQAGQDITQ